MRPLPDRKIRENEILNAAEELFNQYGYRRTKISDISKKIGVVQGTLYYYFSSKEKIAEAIVNRYLSNLKDEIMMAISIEVCYLRKFGLVIDIFYRNLYCKQGLFLEYLYNDKNFYFMDKFFRQSKNLLAPFLFKIIKERKEKGRFNDLHVELAVEYILSIILCNVEAIYKKKPEMTLIYSDIGISLIERILEVEEGILKLKWVFTSNKKDKII